MKYYRHRFWLTVTLYFFVTMLLYHPAFATEQLSRSLAPSTNSAIPINYITAGQLQGIIDHYQRLGFHIEQGSLRQLQRLLLAENNLNVEISKNNSPDQDSTEQTIQSNNQADCKTAVSTSKDQNKPNTDTNNKQIDCNTTKKTINKKPSGQTTQPTPNKNISPMPVTMPNPAPGTEAVETPRSNHTPTSEAPVAVTPQANVNLDLDIFHGGGGNGGDAAKVFFIITGIFVVAAFIVYAGKYIVDITQGKTHDLWWELTINNIYLDTKVGQNGHFSGLKIATGFISSALFQVALVGEIGTTNLKLTLNEDTTPINLDFSANYWMLGATTRIHLTDALVNASYLYLEFLGGKTDRSEADTIGAARAGISFGINHYLRLGASIGAQYIGLSNEQGFINNNDKYWYTYGFEMGVRF